MSAGVPQPDRSEQIDGRLQELYERHRRARSDGDTQYYEPGVGYHGAESAGDKKDTFGIALAGLDGAVYAAGAADELFPMQSMSKVFAYILALEDHGRDQVMKRVGVEPSGDAFSSIVFDEHGHRPYNPMVNAGALVAADLAPGTDVASKRERIVALMRRHAGRDTLDVDWDIYEREMESADRNRATAYLLRSEGMLEGRADDVLALYLQQCSVSVNCRDLAVMAATLANGGVNPLTGEQACGHHHVRDVLTVMYTCGMYDFAGEWAFDVGVPAKSGVSGGILAPIPGKLGIGIFSPGLDGHGNSVRGVDICEEISGRLGLHVFAPAEDDALFGSSAPGTETG